MGTNVCSIYLKVERDGRSLSPSDVSDSIAGYWVSHGCRVGGDAYAKLEPLSLERTSHLAYAVSPVQSGWLTISDSERYTADIGLARHLAATLQTRVAYVGVWDASQDFIEEFFGDGDATGPSGPYDYYDLYYDQLTPTETNGFVFLNLLDVPAGLYRDGTLERPNLEWVFYCRFCEAGPIFWDANESSGLDPENVPHTNPDKMNELGYLNLPAGTNTSVLASVGCKDCGGRASAWVEVVLDDGAFQTSHVVELDHATLNRVQAIGHDCVYEAARLTQCDPSALSPETAVGHLRRLLLPSAIQEKQSED